MSEAEHRPSPWKPGHDAEMGGPSGSRPGSMNSGWWARLERAWWPALIGTMVVFSIFPLANMLLGLSTKDYGLWYQVGRAIRQGMDVYPRPETGRLFPFMYPPSAAAMLGWVSLAGPDRDAHRGRAGHLGVVVGLHPALGLAGGGTGEAEAPAGRDRALAVGHRADP